MDPTSCFAQADLPEPSKATKKSNDSLLQLNAHFKSGGRTTLSESVWPGPEKLGTLHHSLGVFLARGE